MCRTIPDAAQPTQADRDWWLGRYPLEWIRETAAMMYGGGDNEG